MILDTFEYITNKHQFHPNAISTRVNYYIEIRSDINDNIRFYKGIWGEDFSLKRVSKNYIVNILHLLPTEITKYL
jgi:hypothetical protein